MTIGHDDLDPKDLLRLARDCRDEVSVVRLDAFEPVEMSNAEIYRWAQRLVNRPEGMACTVAVLAIQRLDAGQVWLGVVLLRLLRAMVDLEETTRQPGEALH